MARPRPTCPRLYAPAQPFADAIKAWEHNQRRSNGGRPLNMDPNNQVAGLGALAELAGITVRSLWRYTNGESRYIELKLADRLALALDIPLPLSLFLNPSELHLPHPMSGSPIVHPLLDHRETIRILLLAVDLKGESLALQVHVRMVIGSSSR